MISWQTPCIQVTVFFPLWLQLGKKKKHQSSKSFDHYIEFLLDHILTINYWLRKSPTIATCTGSERLKTPKTDYLLTDSRFCWPWKYMVECHHSTPSCHTEFFLPAYTFSQLVYLVSQVVLCLSSPLWFLRFISTISSWDSIPLIPHLGTLNILYIRHYGDKKKTSNLKCHPWLCHYWEVSLLRSISKELYFVSTRNSLEACSCQHFII